MSLTRRLGGALCILMAVVALAGCSRAQAQSSPSAKLLGTWYDSVSGGEYRFVSDSILVVPHAQAGGGNAVSYRILDGDKLDIVAGSSHHVSFIESVTADALTLADPITGWRQHLYRSVSRTQHIKSVEASALAAVSEFATVTPDPTIVWVAKKPTGKGSEWTDWAPTTLSAYGTAWEWTGLKPDKVPVGTSGGGDAMGYSVSFTRKVPTTKALQDLLADTSIEATAGLDHIDVGYSASKAKYAAGTLVYLPGGLIYSLGDGFAIGVALDRKAESFVPRTHK